MSHGAKDIAMGSNSYVFQSVDPTIPQPKMDIYEMFQKIVDDLNKAYSMPENKVGVFRNASFKVAKRARQPSNNTPNINGMLSNLSIRDSKKKGKTRPGGVSKRSRTHFKRRATFIVPVPDMAAWTAARNEPLTKEMGVQADLPNEKYPVCIRAEARRMKALSIQSPSVVKPAPTNARYKDVAVEAPDRTYYSSKQLTYIRVGRFVYRGWTYETLDGKIEHVPRVPVGIPVDMLRLKKPPRTPATI